jgi:putative transferase (TIGR04331 family)
MNSMVTDCPRYLITTADEKAWKFDRPVIFLGEWCRRYDKRHLWQNMDAIVAKPYGLGQAKKDCDQTVAKKFKDELFYDLCFVLNLYHRTDHGERFWQIVLGHWFSRYVDVMLNRANTLEQCFQTYRISGTTGYVFEDYTLATKDSNSAVWAASDDIWNNALYLRIIDLLELADCPVEVIKPHRSHRYIFSELTTPHNFKRSIAKWALRKLGKFSRFFVRDDDALIINSYLPRREQARLQLALGQFPQFWSTLKLETTEEANKSLRATLAIQMKGSICHGLEKLLRVMLFELLPVCYLEGFSNLNASIERLPWPKKPRFIFTSNSFDTDELFKLWAATKVESGFKYFVGQHGNNYGTYRYMNPSTEEATSDKFVTWGWTDGMQQHTPAFLFKTANQKKENYDRMGGLLLIQDMYYSQLDTWDRSAEHQKYFLEQIVFKTSLLEPIQRNLTVRLHSSFKYNRPYEKELWSELIPETQLDAGDVPIRALIRKSRLVVHSYDSTGILETLSQNIPTLAFWQNEFDHLRDSAKPFYQILVDVGIVHLTPKSVAQKVNEIWDDVEGWWSKSCVQDARIQFCERYARSSKNTLKDLKNILI